METIFLGGIPDFYQVVFYVFPLKSIPFLARFG